MNIRLAVLEMFYEYRRWGALQECCESAYKLRN